MQKKYLHILTALAAALVLVACQGGGSSGQAAGKSAALVLSPPVMTGVFVDGPVEGLSFVSGAQAGTTDAAGTFMFAPGGVVQFKVGNVILGQAPGKAVMTPVDLIQAVDAAAGPTDPRVLQIVQFLMTVNASPPTVATMLISSFAATNAATVAAVDLSAAPVDLVPILGVIVPAKTLVSAAAAAAHLQASLAALTAPKGGTFAGLDSAVNPKLGVFLSATPNLVGNGFDVSGFAAGIQGDTWTISGTMDLNGTLQATGTGAGVAPPAAMTIMGAVSSATQLTASVSFTLNLVPQQLSLVLERAVASATAGRLALAADPGVNTATQNQHIAAVLTIMPDGRISASLVESELTGLPICPVVGGRFALLKGVVTSAGNVIAIGGMPGTGETALTRSATALPSVVFLTGTANADGSISAMIASSDITGGGLTVPPLDFVAATNPMAGVFTGTHTDAGSNIPGRVAIGVNNDGSVHGYDRFMSAPLKRFPERDDLIDGVVDPVTGAFGIPPAFAIKNLAPLGIPPAPAGLVITDDDGENFGAFVGVYSGSIELAAGTASGTITTGPVIATESFTTTLLQ